MTTRDRDREAPAEPTAQMSKASPKATEASRTTRPLSRIGETPEPTRPNVSLDLRVRIIFSRVRPQCQEHASESAPTVA